MKAKKLLPAAVLKRKAIDVFHAWIRRRDDGKPCISCGNYKELQAGHYYPAGSHNNLRFHEHNVNGECEDCNVYDPGHLDKYKVNLIKRIGVEAFSELERLSYSKRAFRDDRFYLMEVIERYRK